MFNRLTHFFHSSIRGRLALLVAAVTVPAVLLVGLLNVQAYRNQRKAVEHHLATSARVLAYLIDRQIGESEALLEGLAASRDLQEGNFATFDSQARAAVSPGRWVVLMDRDGRLLVNTRIPIGSPMPPAIFEGEAKAAALQGKIYVSNLEIGPVSKLLRLYVSLPIMKESELEYVLSIAMTPAAFSKSLDMVHIAKGNIVTILDRQGTVVARSQAGERFVGMKATSSFAEALAARSEGVLESVTLDNIPVLTAFNRSPFSGWAAAIAAPRSELYVSAQRLLWLGLAVSVLLMLVATFIAVWIGRAVVHSVESLVSDAEVLAQGGALSGGAAQLAETDFVAQAMVKTVGRLAEKEHDNANLYRALEKELAQQKRSEEASRRLAAIVELSDDAIISKSLEGVVTSWNKGAERIFGYRAEEIIGQPITLVVDPARYHEESILLDRIRRGERIEHYETVRRCKDGSLVSVSMTVSPVADANGNVLGVSTIARDISKRKAAELQQQALFELVARVNRAEALPEIYNVALDAICRSQNADRASILLCDVDGVMRFKASRGLSDAYRQAVEGHSPWQSSDPDPHTIWIDDVSRATLDPNVRRAIEAEGIAALAFVPLADKKRLLGKFVIYYNSPHAFQSRELRPAEAVASQVSFAIERQKGAEALESLVNERTASLRQAIAQMQEFSYSVSHDLRAPVRAMRGYADALMDDYGDRLDEEGRRMLSRIQRSGLRMDRLIQDLLTYSRISQRQLVLEPVSMDRLINEVIQQYPEMQSPRADIRIEGAMYDVLAHEASLAQVVSNLLGNAVKFVPAGTQPRIRIRSARKDRFVRVSFEDNGIGIKPEFQSRLFAMFERIQPDKNYEGTGIGLAIVRKAVERMNGSVGLESDGISGSIFWIELEAPNP